jgi:ribosome-associated toxin RatA of RatAB toxin-antitoxin module
MNITKSVITPYCAEHMYKLVSHIENYPHYLPWCPSAKILSVDGNKVVGRVNISYLKVTTHFTTQNEHIPYQRININLVDGPFKQLHGYWRFTPLGHGCKIELHLDYHFNNIIVEKVIGKVFEFVLKNIVDAFVKKAREDNYSPMQHIKLP